MTEDRMLDRATAVDLLVRWDAQQELYIAKREERFSVIIEAVRLQCGEAPTVIDLACGPGSLGRRLHDRLPSATVWAVDADPLLQAIGRAATDGLRWVEADLRVPDWHGFLEGGTVDAVVSTTALHWLLPPDLVRLYGELARIIRRGGIFLDGDHRVYPPNLPQMGSLGDGLTKAFVAPQQGRAEEWSAWWEAASAMPALKDAFVKRQSVYAAHHGDDRPMTTEVQTAALLDAGFAEAGTLWQMATDWIVAGIR